MEDAQAVAAIRELLKKPIAYHRAFARIGGGATSGLMLSQAWYWTSRTDEDGWFYKTVKEWEEETGLTEAEQEGARKRLTERGLMETKRAGMPARLYYRVRSSECIRLLGQNTESSSGKTPNQVPVKQPNMIGQNSQPLIHREYTENTSEREPAPEPVHSSVQIYIDAYKKTPDLFSQQRFESEVTDLAAWKRVVLKLRTNGTPPKNTGTLLDVYHETVAKEAQFSRAGPGAKPIPQSTETPEQKHERLSKIVNERAQKQRTA